MKVTHLIDSAILRGDTRFAFELLPPLKGDGLAPIFATVDPLMEFDPAYINITFHREVIEAGKVTRKRPGTVGISAAIKRRHLTVEVVPHLICGGFSRYDVEDALLDMDYLGLNNVLALRGDALKEEKSFVPHPDGHNYAEGLVRQIVDMNRGIFVDSTVEKSHHSQFCIGVAGYPEKHSDAPDIDQDIKQLKAKVDAGAEYIVCQMFFDNGAYFSFVDRCRAAGINVPIVPGIKPISALSHMSILPKIFGVTIPDELKKEADKCTTKEQIMKVGTEWAIMQAKELKSHKVPVIHFYTMGRPTQMIEIAREIF